MNIYQRIATDIKSDIESQALKFGDKVPSVNDLRERYGVSHMTVLKAYKELSDLRLIAPKSGQGYYVGGSISSPQSSRCSVIANFVRPLREFNEHDNYFNLINLGIQQACGNNRVNLLNFHCTAVLNQWPISSTSMQNIKNEMIACIDQVDGYLIDERIPDSIVEEVMKFTGKPMMILNRRTALPLDSVSPPNRENLIHLMSLVKRLSYDYVIFMRSGTYGKVSDNYHEIFELFKAYVEQDADLYNQYTVLDDCSLLPFEQTGQKLSAVVKEQRAAGRKILILTDTGSTCRALFERPWENDTAFGNGLGLCAGFDIGFSPRIYPLLATLRTKAEEIGQLAVEKLMRRFVPEPIEPERFSPKSEVYIGETL